MRYGHRGAAAQDLSGANKVCIKPATAPFHAWVQTEDGTPIAEPPSTLAYTPALTIGARHQHQP